MKCIKKFVREARMESANKVATLATCGWRFGLTYGATPMPTRAEFDAFWAGPNGVARRLGFGEASLNYENLSDAWEARERDKTGLHPSLRQWILSASLFPLGRSPVESDWKTLGRLITEIGAPEGSLRTPFETTHPNAVHYWIWQDTLS